MMVPPHSQWNSILIGLANTNTNSVTTRFADCIYKVYAVNTTGDFSSLSSNRVAFIDQSFEVFYPFNEDANDLTSNRRNL